MNKVLRLSGKINHKANTSRPGSAELPAGKSVSSEKIALLITELKQIIDYWSKQKYGFTPLISVQYIVVVAKSNRISYIFSYKGRSPNDSVVGAKFTDEVNPRHIITYSISYECISNTVSALEECQRILCKYFNGTISSDDIKLFNKGKIRINSTISKSSFSQLIKDAYFVQHFKLPTDSTNSEIKGSQLITIYDMGLPLEEILRRIGLKDANFEKLDDRTWLLNPSQYIDLYSKAPYLISMSQSNIRDISTVPQKQLPASSMMIPHPNNEPVIGVLDTLFSNKVYFSEWVEYHELLDPALIDTDDYYHGTAVSSLLVDGPSLNPHLDDGCGRFRVRHFGIAKHGKNSALSIVKAIKEIVLSNKDIKVWNLSLGSEMETLFNCISPEAAILDELQYENDVLFVISGTNNNNRSIEYPRIGAPADSINSLVVNSILYSEKPAPYSRRGPVLCFFNKPDISAYGGDRQDPICVYSNKGIGKTFGTSFAAPWITRKAAFLIYVLKFPRELAKALLIDAACGWNTDTEKQPLIGFGRVPTHISDIVNTQNDEIKFTIFGIAQSYETYAYNIPVPISKERFPYIAKATLCYFPKCSRNQGVDYTDTELDIHFGRINSEGKLKSIDNNMQGNPEAITQYESSARKEFRKWDNIKHISEGSKSNNRSKKIYAKEEALGRTHMYDSWGLSVKKKERLNTSAGEGIHFGLVITLKEIDGINRIEEFIQRCRANSWLTEEVDIQALLENYINEEQDIVFED